MTTFLKEFWMFGIKQAWACLFGGLLLALMLLTQAWYPFENLYRYDFLFIAALVIQAALLLFRLETPREAVVIFVFHLVATGMEIFKTHPAIGSWSYPGDFRIGIAGVPLFAGFMYSAVGSYIARVWKIFEFRFTYHPPLKSCVLLVTLVYANFFSHHFLPDIRWLLLLATAWLFGRTWIYFRVIKEYRRMPLLLGFFLVSVFIWIAENVATYARVWIYPSQGAEWSLVSPQKLIAWFLLMLLSYVLVMVVNQPRMHVRPAVAATADPDS